MLGHSGVFVQIASKILGCSVRVISGSGVVSCKGVGTIFYEFHCIISFNQFDLGLLGLWVGLFFIFFISIMFGFIDFFKKGLRFWTSGGFFAGGLNFARFKSYKFGEANYT